MRFFSPISPGGWDYRMTWSNGVWDKDCKKVFSFKRITPVLHDPSTPKRHLENEDSRVKPYILE